MRNGKKLILSHLNRHISKAHTLITIYFFFCTTLTAAFIEIIQIFCILFDPKKTAIWLACKLISYPVLNTFLYSHSVVVESTCDSHVHTRHVCECVFCIVSLCVLGFEPLAHSLLQFKSLAAFPASSGICRPESSLSITVLSSPHPYPNPIPNHNLTTAH